MYIYIYIHVCANNPVCQHDKPFTNSADEAFTNTMRSQLNRNYHKPFTNQGLGCRVQGLESSLLRY